MPARKLTMLLLLAGAALGLASACGGAAPPQSRLTFLVDRSGDSSIHITRSHGADRTDISASLPWDAFPVWSPDGTRIAFYSLGERDRDIYVAQADGSGVINLTGNPAEDAFPAWSPDSSRITFYSDRDGNGEV
ncbi:MAG: PD40 domain-containing protein, partial [Chloroflexi bacterium]|nr:PD40 domain-containing protein [Chloroflexota bacterium]